MKLALHALVILALTLLTQLGGLAWALALVTRWRWRVFLLIYLLFWGVAQVAAPLLGREPLPCQGDVLHMQSAFYCVAMRNFVAPDLADLARDAAQRVADDYPGTVTLALDGGFPFLKGMPLLPHLSHDDGDKLDLAFYYQSPTGTYLPGQTRAPLGYFAFEALAHNTCPPSFPTLRWDLRWLQHLYPVRPMEPARTTALARALLTDPRLGRMFIEPALATHLGLSDPRLRFQGCRAARHDDHIHIQL
ncbi:hypothetical protein [Gemmobacter serpentinus]|uniref:hypothetical protein n=1 Tax=Gemmobacter serpentinus TaxID=2652247 RepID=UPI00124DFF2A|nr:hypothetical protein [Gemmobacter serpentinus]